MLRLKVSLIQVRHKTWLSNISRFYPKTPPKVVETPEPRQDDLLVSMNQYVRSNDMPATLKRNIMTDKLTSYIKSTENFAPESIKLINSGFSELYRLNNGRVESVMDLALRMQLFKKSSTALVSARGHMRIPKYMSILINDLLKEKSRIPSDVLVYLVDLGSSMSSFETVMRSLASYRHLNSEDIDALATYYWQKRDLDVHKLEVLVLLDVTISETFCKQLNEYVESLFEDLLPEVHEYKDLNRNVHRLQHLVVQILDKNIALPGKFVMLKLASELSSVFNNTELDTAIAKTVAQCLEHPELIKHELFQRPDDANLWLAWLWKQQSKCAREISEFVVADEIRFTDRIQAQIYLKLSELNTDNNRIDSIKRTGQDPNERTAYEAIEPLVEYTPECFTAIVEAAMNIGVNPRGYFTQTLTNEYSKNGVEHPVLAYAHRIHACIRRNNHVQATNIFDDSLEQLLAWSSEVDPIASKALNGLVVLLCRHVDDVGAIFPIFVKIKQQMPQGTCDIDALNSMAAKVLQAEYASDMIEMLKRELPTIDKDAANKLPLQQVWTAKYQQLFAQLHRYVVTYEKDPIYETNWVLYGELHKYFVVPFESYLPTMKFFCEHGRPDWALTVFHQLKKLNELHGVHNHRPPLREMYMYLFEQFGDRLYEDGVVEVHEYLKMDLNLDQTDVQLQNAVLNAYSNLQDVLRAHNLFLLMAADSDHIDENTIKIMIKTYTYNDMAYVQKFWNNLLQYGILPTHELYKQYLIAHVYHGLVDRALELAADMEHNDLEMQKDILLALHNYCLEPEGQHKVREWAEKNHGQLWDAAVRDGLLVGATGYERPGLLELASKD